MERTNLIYFDNAATSWPKPPVVRQAMDDFLENVGANPGRAGHRLANVAGRVVYQTREVLADLFNLADPFLLVFCANATEALNLALFGLLRPGDHVITSSLEHNSLMRPLRVLESRGVDLTVINCTPEGFLDPGEIRPAICPATKLIALTHASNVIGTILPIAEIGQIARENDLLFLVDAAQTAGAIPIDLQADLIDLLAFSGHKSLYGPTGTGGLALSERVNLSDFLPLKFGGTGSHSEFEIQPNFLPDIFESGTLNTVGLAGLGASVRWLLSQGIELMRAHEARLTQQLLDGLQEIPDVIRYGPQSAGQQTATVSFNLKPRQPSEIGLRLDDDFGILCRVGLHCAPAAHKTIGTFPTGTVRFGLSYFNTPEEIDAALLALKKITQETA